MTEILPIDYAVVAVGRTEQEQFPLILVFGRENNGSAEIIPGISLYDETVSSGSAFWNRAYGFIQRLTDWKGHFRQSCVEAEMSPILFTNALPKPIPNALQNKDSLRAAVQENEILSHVSGIFGLNVASRVGAVIFSTGKSAVYEFSRTEVKKACSAKNIPFIEAPYFATQGLPNAVLDQSIEYKDSAIIRSIVNEFRAYTQQVAPADVG
ncbi:MULTISPECIES: hypothetical protein [Methylocaldum]|jgi:hypothetical protein|uniref:hypothetical protein n=1 Tax=Methylocaldum sp. GT1TLB TaxID=3438965 RepID=UPI003DA07156